MNQTRHPQMNERIFVSSSSFLKLRLCPAMITSYVINISDAAFTARFGKILHQRRKVLCGFKSKTNRQSFPGLEFYYCGVNEFLRQRKYNFTKLPFLFQ
jgi:hypothetical protein